MFIKDHICVHLTSFEDKFNILLIMASKLYSLAQLEISEDNLDSLVNQEVLLSGHLYLMFLREKFEELLVGIRDKMYKDAQKPSEVMKIKDISYLKRAIQL